MSMSKQSEVSDERIPTYEESIATSASSILPPSPPNNTGSNRARTARQSFHDRTRNERIRRLTNIVNNHIDPAVTAGLEDGITKIVLILLPTDTFASTTPSRLTTNAITSPPLSLPTTVLPLQPNENLNERPDDYISPFLIQGIVFSDLAAVLSVSLSSSTDTPLPHRQQPISAPLPERPESKSQSWLSRKFGLPPPDHDPTGDTGKWNLGWKSEEDPFSRRAEMDSDEMRIVVKAQEVSFRVENEMGLLESLNVKCLWVELELR
jgi:hypothetical protein